MCAEAIIVSASIAMTFEASFIEDFLYIRVIIATLAVYISFYQL